MAQSTETACSNVEHIDPRVRRTRKLLQDAFRSLVHKKRFSEISIQDIAEEATVNRATFYAHYIDKNDIASSVLKNDLRDAVFQRFAEKPPVNRKNLEQITAAVLEFLAGMQRGCPSASRGMWEIVGPSLQDALYELVEGWLGVSVGFQRLYPGCSKEVVAISISWSIYGCALRWSRENDKASIDKVCKELAILLMPETGGG